VLLIPLNVLQVLLLWDGLARLESFFFLWPRTARKATEINDVFSSYTSQYLRECFLHETSGQFCDSACTGAVGEDKSRQKPQFASGSMLESRERY